MALSSGVTLLILIIILIPNQPQHLAAGSFIIKVRCKRTALRVGVSKCSKLRLNVK